MHGFDPGFGLPCYETPAARAIIIDFFSNEGGVETAGTHGLGTGDNE